MVVFTICSKNFLGYANALFNSLRYNCATLDFYVFLCDSADSLDSLECDFPIIDIDFLGIPNLDDMKNKYNITELNTSIKPFAFQFLFEKYGEEFVVYMDPDILVFSELAELSKIIASGADCVLTPHITEPAEFAERGDGTFVKYGMFNLGFCGLRGTEAVRRIVAWWGRKLERECIIDLSKGLFVDQKWADYLPSFISSTVILRHPGYNVAYWNLSQRRLSRETSGEWRVNNLPLRFFHFSGNKIEDENVFSRHSGQFTTSEPFIRELLDIYRNAVFEAGHRKFSVLPYGFSWTGASGVNEHTPELSRNEQRNKALSAREVVQMTEENGTLKLDRFDDMFSFVAWRKRETMLLQSRIEVENELAPIELPTVISGTCYVCDSVQSFQVSGMYSSATLSDGRVVPNWREHLNCLKCGFISRTRAAIHILSELIKPTPDCSIYITEQVTPLYRYIKDRFDRTVGSEFVAAGATHQLDEGIRFEDIQSLSFGNEEFDIILSFEVLEHVPYPEKAFSEIFRCIKPGGSLLLSAPFSCDHASDVVRAKLHLDGRIEHYLPPEIHGNPVDVSGGSLCFRYFGWDILDKLREAGFRDAKAVAYWSKKFLYLGGPLQFVIVANK